MRHGQYVANWCSGGWVGDCSSPLAYRVHAHGVDNAGSSALCDAGGAIGDIEAISGPGVLLEYDALVLGNRERLSSEEGLVGLEIYALNKSRWGRAVSLLHIVRVGSDRRVCWGRVWRVLYLPDVSWDGVSDLELHDIANGNLCRGNVDLGALADDVGRGRG
jgi:hypothetical protein